MKLAQKMNNQLNYKIHNFELQDNFLMNICGQEPAFILFRRLACIAGGIFCMWGKVLVVQPWVWATKLWGEWRGAARAFAFFLSGSTKTLPLLE